MADKLTLETSSNAKVAYEMVYTLFSSNLVEIKSEKDYITAYLRCWKATHGTNPYEE